jgi:hypothetical protein
VATVNCGRLAALAVVLCWATCGSPIAYADWAACQSKPTRSCLIEEALRGESGPPTGKDRLDVLLDAGVPDHIEEATAADIKEAQRLASAPSPGRYRLLAVQGLAAANQWEEAFELVRSSSGNLQSLAFAGLIRAMVKAGKQDEIAGLGMRMPRPFDINTMITEIVKALDAVLVRREDKSEDAGRRHSGTCLCSSQGRRCPFGGSNDGADQRSSEPQSRPAHARPGSAPLNGRIFCDA